MFLLSRCSCSPLVPVPPRSQPESCSAKKEHSFPYPFYSSPLVWFLHCWDKRRQGGGSESQGTKALISIVSCSLCPLQSHYSNVGFLMAHTCEIGKGGVFLTHVSPAEGLLSGLMFSGPINLRSSARCSLSSPEQQLSWFACWKDAQSWLLSTVSIIPTNTSLSLPMSKACSAGCFAAKILSRLSVIHFSFSAWQRAKICKPTA